MHAPEEGSRPARYALAAQRNRNLVEAAGVRPSVHPEVLNAATSVAHERKSAGQCIHCGEAGREFTFGHCQAAGETTSRYPHATDWTADDVIGEWHRSGELWVGNSPESTLVRTRGRGHAGV